MLADHSIGGAPGSATGYANCSGNDRVVLILSIMLITFVNSWQLHMSAMTTLHPQTPNAMSKDSECTKASIAELQLWRRKLARLSMEW